MLAPEQAQLVAMAVHELATNAAKYGSLSVETGRVDVSWSVFEGVLTLAWREIGRPDGRPRPTKRASAPRSFPAWAAAIAAAPIFIGCPTG